MTRRDEPWQELADGVFRRRYASLDLNVGLVVGAERVLVIDTRAHHGQADELLAHVREVTALPVDVVVNTHHHWDHTFGNARFRGAELVGHERCRQRLVDEGADVVAHLSTAAWLPDEARRAIAQVDVCPPTTVMTDALDVDLGGLVARLSHLGRGHTDNDVVVTVGDVVFAGDLVEEGAPPSFGDAYPREWVATLDRLLPTITGTVVPGHGDVVDHAFVAEQRDAIQRAVDGEPVFADEVMAVVRARLDAG